MEKLSFCAFQMIQSYKQQIIIEFVIKFTFKLEEFCSEFASFEISIFLFLNF